MVLLCDTTASGRKALTCIRIFVMKDLYQMNDFISHEAIMESSKVADATELLQKRSAAAMMLKHINKKKIYRGTLFVLIGWSFLGHIGTAAKIPA